MYYVFVGREMNERNSFVFVDAAIDFARTLEGDVYIEYRGKVIWQDGYLV